MCGGGGDGVLCSSEWLLGSHLGLAGVNSLRVSPKCTSHIIHHSSLWVISSSKQATPTSPSPPHHPSHLITFLSLSLPLPPSPSPLPSEPDAPTEEGELEEESREKERTRGRDGLGTEGLIVGDVMLRWVERG